MLPNRLPRDGHRVTGTPAVNRCHERLFRRPRRPPTQVACTTHPARTDEEGDLCACPDPPRRHRRAPVEPARPGLRIRHGEPRSGDRPGVRRARGHLRGPPAGDRPHALAPDAREQHRRLRRRRAGSPFATRRVPSDGIRGEEEGQTQLRAPFPSGPGAGNRSRQPPPVLDSGSQSSGLSSRMRCANTRCNSLSFEASHWCWRGQSFSSPGSTSWR